MHKLTTSASLRCAGVALRIGGKTPRRAPLLLEPSPVIFTAAIRAMVPAAAALSQSGAVLTNMICEDDLMVVSVALQIVTFVFYSTL
jgi:hypothetical protein